MIHIVTDAAVRFPNTHAFNRDRIRILPLQVQAGSQLVDDSPNADLQAISQIVSNSSAAPEIVEPSTDDIAAVYSDMQRHTSQIVSIHSSSGFCASYQNALTASQQFRGRMDIQVIDSESISLGLGMIVQAAVQAAERSENLDNIVRIVRGMIPRVYSVLFLDDLFFLERYQLISRSQAILGNMLGIIPFLTMEDGNLIPMEKVRSRQRALEKLIEFICEFSSVDQIGILLHKSTPTEEGHLVIDRLRSLYPSTPITTSCYGPAVSTYLGFHGMGAVVQETAEGSII